MKQYEQPSIEVINIVSDMIVTSTLTNTGTNLDAKGPESGNVNNMFGGN